MSDKPLKTPDWNTGLTNNLEPSDADKVLGFEVVDDPPSSLFNWLFELIGSWLTWLNDRTSNAGAAPRIGLRGINTTAEDANGTGITATGNGTGSAVKGVTPATAATALEADASAGTGYGAVLKSNAARSPARLVPQTPAPTIPLKGDLYVDDATDALSFYDGTAWHKLNSDSGPYVTIGDGVTTFGDFDGVDNTPFTAAIAALPATGGTIIVKPGTYTFATKLAVVKANVTLAGLARESCLITGAINGDSVISLDAAGCTLRGLSVTQSQGPSTNYVVTVTAENTTIEDCHLLHSYAGTNADTAAYKVLRLLASYCRVRFNKIEWYPSVKTGGGVDRAGILIYVIGILNTGATNLYGIEVTHNFFYCQNPAAAAVTSNSCGVLIDQVAQDQATAVIDGLKIVNNFFHGHPLDASPGGGHYFYGLFHRMVSTATNSHVEALGFTITGNSWQEETFVLVDGIGIELDESNLTSGSGTGMAGSCIMGNFFQGAPTLHGFGGATPQAGGLATAFPGLFVALSSGGAVTHLIGIDDLNKK